MGASVNMVNAGSCLALNVNQYIQTEFTFNHGDCTAETMSVICKLEDLESAPSELLPSFPCMSLNSKLRKKRSYVNNKENAGRIARSHDDEGRQNL